MGIPKASVQDELQLDLTSVDVDTATFKKKDDALRVHCSCNTLSRTTNIYLFNSGAILEPGI
jgi:hypothetical protein